MLMFLALTVAGQPVETLDLKDAAFLGMQDGHQISEYTESNGRTTICTLNTPEVGVVSFQSRRVNSKVYEVIIVADSCRHVGGRRDE